MLPLCILGVLKKSEPQLHSNVILPSPARGDVGGWVDTGEAVEVTREVRLVCISASESQLRPTHFGALVQSTDYALKASHPAPLLGRKTNILTEDMVQP